MEKICRACLKVSSQLKHIFHADKGHIVLMIKQCTSMNVYTNDGLPDSLCMECYQNLHIAFKFWELFMHSDKVLRATLNIKQNPSTISQPPDLIYYTNNFMENPPRVESDECEAELVKPETKDKYKPGQSTKSFILTRNCNSSSQISYESEDLDYNSEIKQKRCLLCDIEFSSNSLLLQHQHDVHSEACNGNSEMIAEMTDGNDNEIEQNAAIVYVRSESSNDEYRCDYCNMAFTTINKLKVHTLKHTEKKELFRRDIHNRHVEDGYEYATRYVLCKNDEIIKYLRCVRNGRPTKCPATAKLIDQHFIPIRNKHNHDRKQDAEEVLHFRTALQDMARSNPSKPKEIYDLVAMLYPIGAAQTPYVHLKTTICRWQRQTDVASPKDDAPLKALSMAGSV